MPRLLSSVCDQQTVLHPYSRLHWLSVWTGIDHKIATLGDRCLTHSPHHGCLSYSRLVPESISFGLIVLISSLESDERNRQKILLLLKPGNFLPLSPRLASSPSSFRNIFKAYCSPHLSSSTYVVHVCHGVIACVSCMVDCRFVCLLCASSSSSPPPLSLIFMSSWHNEPPSPYYLYSCMVV